MNVEHAPPVIQTLAFKTLAAGFPHIARRIALFWGHAELVAYLRELQGSHGELWRDRFTPEVLSAIAELEIAHDRAFPHLAHVDTDFWDTF